MQVSLELCTDCSRRARAAIGLLVYTGLWERSREHSQRFSQQNSKKFAHLLDAHSTLVHLLPAVADALLLQLALHGIHVCHLRAGWLFEHFSL